MDWLGLLPASTQGVRRRPDSDRAASALSPVPQHASIAPGRGPPSVPLFAPRHPAGDGAAPGRWLLGELCRGLHRERVGLDVCDSELVSAVWLSSPTAP